jgi:hypothetical protein
MSQTTYRLIFLALGLGLIAVIVGAVLLAPSGDPLDVPDTVERFSPADGATVLEQTTVVLDLAPGYRVTFTIDGIVVPPEEVIATEATGRHEFIPGPGKVIEGWATGFHVVEAHWDRVSGLPDPGTLIWSFRVS